MSSREKKRNTMVGDWEIHEKLGDGGMGIVYRASHVLISGDFALKMLRPEFARDHSVVNRFLAEVKKARLLDHPNIVRMELPFRAGESIYLPMELLHGSSLGQLIEEEPEPWPIDRTLEIIYQAAAGLGHAHSRSVLHRDIKPENIFITATGRVKILDFGFAKKLGDQSLTAEGMAVGTPVYMAPEILQGKKPIAASDMYALGMVLFRMVTGRLPIPIQDTAATVAEIFGSVLHAHEEGLPRPSAFRPGLPDWLDVLSAQLLDRNPDNRPSNGAALARFLESHRVRSDGTVSQDLPAPPPRATSGEYYPQTPPFNQIGHPAPTPPPHASSAAHQLPLESTGSQFPRIAIMALVVLITAIGTWLLSNAGKTTHAEEQETKAANKAAVAQVSFSSEPSGAAVIINGIEICSATPCSGSSKIGSHSVRFQKAKYDSHTQVYELKTTGTRIHAKLQAQFGKITIATQPSGLDIFIDGQSWGPSPVNSRELPAGPHLVEIKSANYKASQMKFNLAGGEHRTLQLTGITRQRKKPDLKYDEFFELDVPKKPQAAGRDPSFDLEP